MSPRPLLLDFQERPRRGGWTGAVLLLTGICAVATTGWQFRELMQKRAGLELRLEALEASRATNGSAASSSALEDPAPVINSLGAPWSLLLQELESASHDSTGSVAVLAVEPDKEKGRIRIVAEARDLGMALAYIQRLQKSRALRFPMLDSHEIRTDDREQPVRFQLSADWRAAI
jgi:hypothetical protein